MNKERILIKISGEALMGKSRNGIDVSTIKELVTRWYPRLKMPPKTYVYVLGGRLGASRRRPENVGFTLGILSWPMSLKVYLGGEPPSRLFSLPCSFR